MEKKSYFTFFEFFIRSLLIIFILKCSWCSRDGITSLNCEIKKLILYSSAVDLIYDRKGREFVVQDFRIIIAIVLDSPNFAFDGLRKVELINNPKNT